MVLNMTKIKKENARKVMDQFSKKSGKSKKEIVVKIKAQLPKKTGKSKKEGIKKSVKIAIENIAKCVEVKENVENIKPVEKIEPITNSVTEQERISEHPRLRKSKPPRQKPKVETIQIQKKLAKEAISALKKLNEHFSTSKAKKPLLDDSSENHVFLQVTLHKIPSKLDKKIVKIKLPHSLLTDTTEVCLITGDLDKKDVKAEIEPTVLHYKQLLKKQGVKEITQVVPLRQLRTEYKTFESKRQLSAAYDVFLCDQKICGVLPNLLGKAFYQKRKFPIQFNMSAKNLKQQVDKALSEIVFPISCRGNSCTSEVARLSMEDDEILENILACVEILTHKIAGRTMNIQGLYIKTARSEAIPIYISYDVPAKSFKNAKRRRERGVEEEELSTLANRKVKVYKDGRIRLIRTNDSEDEESSAKQTIKTEEVLPKSTTNKAEKKNKSKKRKVVKEENSAEED